MLQYTYDTIFLLQDDYNSARNLKFIICLFEHMSGFKTIFHKSELFLFGDAINNGASFAEMFNCPTGSLPMRYLGLPVDEKRIRNKHWKSPEDKMEKNVTVGQVDSWPMGAG